MDQITGYFAEAGNFISQINPTSGTLAVLAFTLFVLYNWDIWDRHAYPPGPLGLPFIGNGLWFMTRDNVFKEIYGLRRKYGDVISMTFGNGRRSVFLNSPDAIKEAFVQKAEVFSQVTVGLHCLFFQGKGLSEPDGRWQKLRKHLMTVLREQGLGENNIDSLITDEISHCLKVIEATKGEPYDMESLMIMYTSNITSKMVLGTRFDYSDVLMESLKLGATARLKMVARELPFIKNVPFDVFGYHKEERKVSAGIQLVLDQIDIHKRESNLDDPPKDFIDSFLKEIRLNEKDPDTVFTDNNLKTLVTGLLLASTDTIAYTLYWAFLYMICYPEVQENIHSEIRQILGEKRPAISDRHKLPYTMSTLTELLRVAMVAPVSLPRQVEEDVTICGVHIPKGSNVFGITCSTCFDEDTYPNPESFKPDRFLDADGEFQKPDRIHLAAFGVGRRACAGEQLARAEYFLLFVSMVQKYQLELGQEKWPSVKETIKLSVVPKENFKIRAIQRF